MRSGLKNALSDPDRDSDYKLLSCAKASVPDVLVRSTSMILGAEAASKLKEQIETGA